MSYVEGDPHVGVAAYFTEPIWKSRARVERVAVLLVEKDRWPWIPWWVSSSAIHPRDDRSMVRVGGKNGTGPIVDILLAPEQSTMRLNRARGDGDYANVSLDLGRRNEERYGNEATFELLITCRSYELPYEKTMQRWMTLVHELIDAVGAIHATAGVWPTPRMAMGDTWLVNTVLDTPQRDINLGLPEQFREQTGLISKYRRYLGRTYARHPRWGTYLNATHVAAIGGVERIRSEVQPARIDELAAGLTYIQLTESVDTALTAACGEKRRKLEALMAPILLGAPNPAVPGTMPDAP